MKNNEKDFEIFGLPLNEEIEIPNKNEKSSKKSSASNGAKEREINDLKKQLPPDLLKMIDQMSNMAGATTDEILSDVVDVLNGEKDLSDFEDEDPEFEGYEESGDVEGAIQSLIDSLTDAKDKLTSLKSSPDENDCRKGCKFKDECGYDPEKEDWFLKDLSKNIITDGKIEGCMCSEDNGYYPLGDWINSLDTNFQKYTGVHSENLWDQFQEEYGSNPESYNEDLIKIIDLQPADFKYILNSEIKFIKNFDDDFLVFYAQQKEPEVYGFYITVYKKPDGNFGAFVSKYGNTYIPTEKGSNQIEALYDIREEEYQPYFGIESKKFLLYLEERLETGIRFELWLKPQNTVLKISDIGSLYYNVKSSKDLSMIQIGDFRFSKSKEKEQTVNLFKKDYKITKATLPVYLKFPTSINSKSSSILEALLQGYMKYKEIVKNFKEMEVKYSPENGGYLYIEYNLGKLD